MSIRETLDKKHKATYTVGSEVKTTEITAREIVQYGLKRAIRYHAALLGLSLTKYHCHVEGMEEKKVSTNKLTKKKENGKK